MHDNAVLTVGSVAAKDMEADGIYQGNPAVKIRERKIKEKDYESDDYNFMLQP